jgi:ribosomal protein L30E
MVFGPQFMVHSQTLATRLFSFFLLFVLVENSHFLHVNFFFLFLFIFLILLLVRMSDTEGDAVQVDEGVELAGGVEIRQMDPNSALREVLKKALQHGGLARGLRECVKALDRREGRLCVLASQCDEPAYVDLVKALCKHHNIKVISFSFIIIIFIYYFHEFKLGRKGNKKTTNLFSFFFFFLLL